MPACEYSALQRLVENVSVVEAGVGEIHHWLILHWLLEGTPRSGE